MLCLDTGFNIMINFFSENIPSPTLSERVIPWISQIITEEGKKEGEINYIFCDDEHLLQINRDFLDHDYYTDIITFDYVKGKIISGDIFVSLPRIQENAKELQCEFSFELNRVLAHGILHLCGYQDKTSEQQQLMREKENYFLAKF